MHKSSCSKAPKQHDTANPFLHILDVILGLSNTRPPFPNDGHHAQSLQKVFVPECIYKPLCGILCCFWNNGFFRSEWPCSSCRYRTCFTVDNDTLLPASSNAFTRYFPFILGSNYTLKTFISGILLPKRYGGLTMPCCLYLCTIVPTFRHLKIVTRYEPDFL
ncbi:hypothetical protein ILYODFUR_008168 [Ilyodon furcidens]|uniref:Uncharacterized protein n=1 Tax=Ilyodon furcidens TaxID=33524 RepID=A0ABV0UEB2_9TELE